MIAGLATGVSQGGVSSSGITSLDWFWSPLRSSLVGNVAVVSIETGAGSTGFWMLIGWYSSSILFSSSAWASLTRVSSSSIRGSPGSLLSSGWGWFAISSCSNCSGLIISGFSTGLSLFSRALT